MMNKAEMKKVVQHIIKRERGIPDRRLLHPKREWGTAVVIMSVVFLGGAYVAYSEYLSQSELTEVRVDSGVLPVTYDQKDAKRTNALYGARQARYDELVELPAAEQAPSEDGAQTNDAAEDAPAELGSGNPDDVGFPTTEAPEANEEVDTEVEPAVQEDWQQGEEPQLVE